MLLWFSVFWLCFLFYFDSVPFCVSPVFSVSPLGSFPRCFSICVSLNYLTCPLPFPPLSPHLLLVL